MGSYLRRAHAAAGLQVALPTTGPFGGAPLLGDLGARISSCDHDLEPDVQGHTFRPPRIDPHDDGILPVAHPPHRHTELRLGLYLGQLLSVCFHPGSVLPPGYQDVRSPFRVGQGVFRPLNAH